MRWRHAAACTWMYRYGRPGIVCVGLFRLRLSSSLSLSFFAMPSHHLSPATAANLVPSLFRDSLLGYSWRGPPSSTHGSAAAAAPIMPGEVIDGSVKKDRQVTQLCGGELSRWSKQVARDICNRFYFIGMRRRIAFETVCECESLIYNAKATDSFGQVFTD